MAPCVSDWPEGDNSLDLEIFKEVSMVLQVKGIAKDLWFPIRRSSNDGPLHFNYNKLVNGIIKIFMQILYDNECIQ